jgi:hypothetical protein
MQRRDPKPATTLATEASFTRPTGVTRLHDVTVTVTTSPRGHTLIEAGQGGHDHYGVTLRLTEAERISLIEALGGTVS